MKVFETNYNEKKFIEESNLTTSKDAPNITFTDKIDQEIYGFGAAITESAGYAYSKLNEEDKKRFLKDYEDYSIFRLGIASTDFSISSYSYAYKKDLSDFSIDRDKEYIIPLIHDIQKNHPNIEFFASPWSPPAFMKNINSLYLGSHLKRKYYETYAEYFVKFFKAYKDENINICYMSIQNETTARQTWESCLFSPDEEADFAINYLYPAIKAASLDIKIFIHDHNKDNIVERCNKIFETNNSNCISGIANHWYTGDYFENLLKCHESFPDKLIFHTEGCVGFSHFRESDEILNAEKYAHDMIGDLNSGSSSYIDWNILLDENGGPNHKKNYCNSPSMLKDGSYYNNLCYYYIQHFARFIKPGAHRLIINSNLESVAFQNPDKSIVFVCLNRSDNEDDLVIDFKGKTYSKKIKSHSIVTLLS
jgi:glucosylceramidase